MKIKPFIAVDHHLSHRNYGDYRWIDSSRSSTGEMIYEICEALGHTPSFNCAFALYVAIVTDTGSFKYECTRSRTLEIAGKLLARGVKPEKVAAYLYDNFTPQRLKLMELVLGTLELHEKDTIALIHVTRDMFEKSGAVVQDVEGFVDYPRSLQSVKFAIFLKEGKDDAVSVSFRSKGDCDVAAIAKHFGGGGHRNAAGCRFSGLRWQMCGKRCLTIAILLSPRRPDCLLSRQWDFDMLDGLDAGVLLVDKPAGATSFAMVRAVRKIFGIKKVGHAGTLDPFATGLLIICIGRPATKMISLFMNGEKEYLATLRLGARSSTQDPEGEIIMGNWDEQYSGDLYYRGSGSFYRGTPADSSCIFGCKV